MILEALVLVTSDAGGSGLAVEVGYTGWITMGGYPTAVDVVSEGLLTFVSVSLVEECGVILLEEVEPRLSSSETGVM